MVATDLGRGLNRVRRRLAELLRTPSIVAPLLLGGVLLLGGPSTPLLAQDQATPDGQTTAIRARIDALLGVQDDGAQPEQWRSLGAAAVPILESIVTDPTKLPTRRARAIEGLAVLGPAEAPAVFEHLAASTQEPLVVRMSALRGLGTVLDGPRRLTELTPFLQAAHPQLRGVAAEVLSQDAAGCAAVAPIAQRETDAWRARFVQRCPGVSAGSSPSVSTSATPIGTLSTTRDAEDGGDTSVHTVPLGSYSVYTDRLSSPIVVEVPPAAASMELVGVAADPTARVIVFQIIDPSGRTVFSYASQQNLVKTLPAPTPGSFAILLPNSPTVQFLPGKWTFYLIGARATTANVEALIKTASNAQLSSGVLDMNVFFVGVPGLNASSAPTDPNFQAIVSKMESIYREVGVSVGHLTYIDITGADATRFADLSFSDLGALDQLSSNPLARDHAANVFLVHSILAGGSGFLILGVSAGIPGTPIRGSTESGVALTMADYPMGVDALAADWAHETSHWLGLFHTTEASGLAFDPLPDTPECPRVPYDTNQDGLMEVQECLGQDATNLLFWTADPAVPAIKLTPNQQFVVLRNPIVRQGGEQD